ncbi:MAG: CRISPR-associated protein Csx15 [Caldilineaceae bacterium]
MNPELELIQRQLYTMLATLYPTQADLTRIMHDAGLSVTRVTIGNGALNDWHAVLREATHQERIAQLLALATEEYPRNRALADAVQAYHELTQSIRVAALPPSNLRLLNFTRELTAEQIQQIELALGKRIGKLINRPADFVHEQPYGPQCVALAEHVGLTKSEWETLPIVVNPPGMAPGALCLISELHGRMGYFPAMVRLRPETRDGTRVFEVAEILNLQEIRDRARQRA